jgi:hypothetical protein
VRYLAGAEGPSIVVGTYGDLIFVAAGRDGVIRVVAPVYSPLPSFDAEPDFGVRMLVGGVAEGWATLQVQAGEPSPLFSAVQNRTETPTVWWALAAN